jgi:predicted component of type VI protein secretion system
MSADTPRIHTFLVVKEPDDLDRVVVWDTQQISIGRSAENDIAVDHVEISRRHAQFECTDKTYSVRNLNASNGTLVNGEPTANQALESGDVIRISELEIVFYQSAKNPSALGMKLEYASQLKGFDGPAISAADGEATMLGLVDTLSGDDEDFEVKPARDFAYDLHGLEGGPPPESPARDLDLELDDFGLDDLEIPEAPARATPAAAPAEAVASRRGPDFFELDDVNQPPSAVSLHLEIQGLEGDLRRMVQALAGKVIQLPSLKIRVVEDELD